MSELVLQDQKCWFDGYDLTGLMNAIALNYGADAVEKTVFGDDTHVFLPGLKTVDVQCEGYVDASAVDGVLYSNVATANKVLSFAASDSAAGAVAYTLLSMLGSYSQQATVGEIFTFSLSASATQNGDNSGLIRGTLMIPGTALTETGASTARELGAVSATQRLYAALHVISASDSDTLDVTITSDATDDFTGDEDTEITFSQVSAVGAQFASAAGAITNTWYRVDYTIAGTDPEFEVVVILGIQ